MSGIFGKLSDPNKISSSKELNWDKLIDLLKHRGPDDEGYWSDPKQGIYLGHTRLAIIDLSKQAHQPMESEGYVIVFSGEVYNYVELRRELQGRDIEFRSNSAAEVVLHGYKVWGEKCLDRFDGMFALAIWNPKGELFLARDPFGEKPLYWSFQKGSFVFSSKLKAVLAMLEEVQTSEEGVVEYLLHGYYPHPRTFYKNTYKLSPGHYLLCKSGQEPVLRRYWSPIVEKEAPREMDLSEKIDRIGEELEKSVSLRLRADVPVGILLSGGVDSSLVAAIVAKQKKKVTAFTMSFSGESVDESKEASQVAKYLGMKQQIFPCSEKEAQEIVPTMLTFFQEPFGNYGTIPLFYLFGNVSREVKVVLGGIGGDEFFYGYNKYFFLKKYESFFRLPYPIRRIFAAILEYGFSLSRLSGFFAACLKANSDYARFITVKNGASVKFLDKEGLLKKSEVLGSTCWNPQWSYVRQGRCFDLCYSATGDLMAIEQVAMSFSVEVRTPFLSRRIYQEAENFRPEDNMVGGKNKVILRKVAERYFPPNFLERPKQGFTPPMEKWIKAGLLDDYLQVDMPFFPRKVIEEVLAEHKKGKRNHSTFLYRLASLGAFLK